MISSNSFVGRMMGGYTAEIQGTVFVLCDVLFGNLFAGCGR